MTTAITARQVNSRVDALESRVAELERKFNTPQEPAPPQPPVDNDHVEEGAEQFFTDSE
jgi:hypothetical protein